MRHVSIQRWAALMEGRLSEDFAYHAELHAESCDRCFKTRTGVIEAKRSLMFLSSETVHSLPWEHIGARIYWSRAKSPELSAATPRRFSHWRAICVGIAVAVLLATSWSVFGGERRTAADAGSFELIPTMVAGEVQVDGAPLETVHAAMSIAIGEEVRTGKGRAWVQLGGNVTVQVGLSSRLRIESFDAEGIQLSGSGNLDVAALEGAPKVQLNGKDVTPAANTQILVPREAIDKSASLAILSDASAALSVDGVPLAGNKVKILVPLGRHLIEWTNQEGKAKSRWVDIRHPHSLTTVLAETMRP